jgi:GNAT superfamily N-acetyltransferase
MHQVFDRQYVIGLPSVRHVATILRRNMTARPIRTCNSTGVPMHDILPDGVVRKMWRSEAEHYRDHLLRLDIESRRSRFAGAVADDFVRRYAELSLGIDTVIHGFFVNGTMRGAAELRTIGAPLAREAEAALSIEKPWQSHGVGSALLKRMLLAARNRGIRFLHMACLADNKRMQQLAAKFDAELTFDFGSVIGAVAAPRPTPLSILREMVIDHHGFATAVLDVQSRILRQA